MTQPRPKDLSDQSLHINRELALLAFNRRVLEQAKDPATPLLERLRFLAICSTNLDEFFEIRVASHHELVSFGVTKPGSDGRTPAETLSAISETAHELVNEQYQVLNEQLLPALEAESIQVIRREKWTSAQQRWIKDYFLGDVLPILTPMSLDPAHPFPRILNKSLNFVMLVEGEDAFGRSSNVAIVQVPRVLPRLIKLPSAASDGEHDFVLLSSVVHAHIDEVVPGMKVNGCYQFRVTRNGDLWVEEEDIDDLLKAVEGELPERAYSDAVRLEVAQDCPEELARFLLEKFELGTHDLYRVDGPVNLHRLHSLYDLIQRADLKFAPFYAHVNKRLEAAENIFEALKKGDVLLHHPYESFAPVLDLVRQAAADPDVLAIKQTLYRVGTRSALVEALIEAARAGKEVTVVIELRARFDEAHNIGLATRLQEVGANVVYGIVGFKTHAKMLMVVRREGDGIRRYVHLGTGNYHAGTARAYTDIGFMTANPEFGEDVHDVFMQLTGLGKVPQAKKLLQSPFSLHAAMTHLIEAEAENARAGREARIIVKMNSLTESSIIQSLYRASRDGVRIDLIIRGACCLRPGVPGVSENIRVRSIVGRFLEHSRVFFFHAGGEQLVFCSSADWMSRNFFRRVEVCFPIESAEDRARIIRECFEVPLADNLQAWELASDGTYSRVQPQADERHGASQTRLLDDLARAEERDVQPATGLSGALQRLEGRRTNGKARRKKARRKKDPRKSPKRGQKS